MAGRNDMKYIANEDYVLRKILNEFMLIPIGRQMVISNKAITISESAAYLWNNMREGKTETELVELLCSEYEVDGETALIDIRALIEDMVAKQTIMRCEN